MRDLAIATGTLRLCLKRRSRSMIGFTFGDILHLEEIPHFTTLQKLLQHIGLISPDILL